MKLVYWNTNNKIEWRCTKHFILFLLLSTTTVHASSYSILKLWTSGMFLCRRFLFYLHLSANIMAGMWVVSKFVPSSFLCDSKIMSQKGFFILTRLIQIITFFFDERSKSKQNQNRNRKNFHKNKMSSHNSNVGSCNADSSSSCQKRSSF